ncbi:hypothetical protein [Bacillus sp. FSL R12-0069]|uniref:hypothetical protein n=1 Tax=Bacillus sp. FSL R12-0069 TaxID=2975342 RepID=UPI0030F6321A
MRTCKKQFPRHIPILLPFGSPRRNLLGIPNGTVDINRGEDYMRSQYSYLNVTWSRKTGTLNRLRNGF